MNDNLENRISLLIKTFERKDSLIRLLRSLEKMNWKLPILIADDSRHPYGEEICSQFKQLPIYYYPLPFDTGLAAGRNFLLQKLTTPYFLLCDDDFILDQQLNLEETLLLAEEHHLDIAGGCVLNFTRANNLKRWIRIMLTPSLAWRFITGKALASYHTGNFMQEDKDCTLWISNNKPFGTIYHCDLVNNFFIAKTDSILNMQGWDSDFKVGEHEDFFFRAKLKGLKVAFADGFVVRHYPVSTKSYLSYRKRSLQFKNHFVEKFGFKSYTEIDKHSGKTIFSYPNGAL